jgi:hypothetical protein
MLTLEQAAEHWAAKLNERYGLDTNVAEVLASFRVKFDPDETTDDGRSYIDVFLKDKDGGWSKRLDAMSYEMLAEGVEEARTALVLAKFAEAGTKSVSLNFNLPACIDTPSEVLAAMRQMMLSALDDYSPATSQEALLKFALLQD